MNNTGNNLSYSGTSTFRGFQHPRLLSGSEEPSDQEKPYGPKPIYYPVSMQKNTMDLASFNVPPPSPPMPYMMPPQQSQPKKPSIQYICNRGQRTTAPSAPVVAAAPPAAAAPACSSCGQQTCAPSCRHKSYDKDRARQKIKKIEQRWEQKWEQEWEQEWSREKEQKKQEKKEKKAAKKRATPTPVVPYTSNLLAPTGLGMVPSLMAAYGFTQMSAVAPPISAVQPTAAAAAAAAPAASGLGQNLPYPYQYGGYGPPAQQQQPQQPQQK